MRLNRRSVLLGLGTISATVGGAFGSGAFSSVEATRSVKISTAGDSSALLKFEPNNPTDESDNNIITTKDESSTSVIKIKQESLNEKATTTFSDALKITNDGEKNVGVSVDPTASDDTNDLIGSALDIEDGDENSIVDDDGNEGGNAVDLDADSSITLTVVVDLQSNTGAAIDSINSIVFAARQSDYNGSQ